MKCKQCGYNRKTLNDGYPTTECPICGLKYENNIQQGMASKSKDSIPSTKTIATKTKFIKLLKAVAICWVILAVVVAINNGYKEAKKEKLEKIEKARIEKIAAARIEEERKKKEIFAKLAKIKREKERLEREKNCPNNLQCWGDKHMVNAMMRCKPAVERMAKYSHRWTDSWLEAKFPYFRWKKKSQGIITYFGDRIQFQNGFGAWQYQTYQCDYDPSSDKILDVRIYPGRLQVK